MEDSPPLKDISLWLNCFTVHFLNETRQIIFCIPDCCHLLFYARTRYNSSKYSYTHYGQIVWHRCSSFKCRSNILPHSFSHIYPSQWLDSRQIWYAQSLLHFNNTIHISISPLRILTKPYSICDFPYISRDGGCYDDSGWPLSCPENNSKRKTSHSNGLYYMACSGCPYPRTTGWWLPDNILALALDIFP